MQPLARTLFLGTAAAIGAGIVLAILVVAGIICLLLALTTALQPVLGETGALALTGALCLAVAVCVPTLMLYRGGRHNRKRAESGSSGLSLETTRRLIRENPWEAAGVALLLGYSMDGGPELRRLLVEVGITHLRDSDDG